MATTVSHTSVRATPAALNYPPAPTTPTVPVSSVVHFDFFVVICFVSGVYLGIFIFGVPVFPSPDGLYQTTIVYWNLWYCELLGN